MEGNNKLSHFDKEGKAIMIDVSEKTETKRVAVARGKIAMKPETLRLIEQGKMGKGDVLGVARVAAIMAAKKTWELIPMCHPLMLTGCEIDFSLDRVAAEVIIEAVVKTTGKTGVEMEALTAASTAALTIYDMCKSVDKGMVIGNIHLVEKSGGKSGSWRKED